MTSLFLERAKPTYVVLIMHSLYSFTTVYTSGSQTGGAWADVGGHGFTKGRERAREGEGEEEREG